MAVPPLIDFPVPTFLRRVQQTQELPYFLFRTSHSQSASWVSSAGIFCGCWTGHNPDLLFQKQWMYDTPENQFDCHFNSESARPTMLISTTPEFLRALSIAVKHLYRGYHDIRITIIDVRKAMASHHCIANAGDIARTLKWNHFDVTVLKSEWVFLGRIRACAIVHQIDFDMNLFESVCSIFPTLRRNYALGELRSIIPGDFRIYDQYLFDGSNEAKDDGRRCAMLANWMGPWTDAEKVNVYLLLIEAIRKWKQTIFSIPEEDYRRDFVSAVDLYAPNVFYREQHG